MDLPLYYLWYVAIGVIVLCIVVGVLWLGDDPPDVPREDEK